MTQPDDLLLPYRPDLPGDYYTTPRGDLHGPTGRFKFGQGEFDTHREYRLEIQMFDGAPNKFYFRPATWEETVRFIDARNMAIRDSFFWRNIAYWRGLTRGWIGLIAVLEFIFLAAVLWEKHHG